ncbi:MAG: hypothetical protein ACRDSR_13715 [Pseudonocardiaceae bacterium]
MTDSGSACSGRLRQPDSAAPVESADLATEDDVAPPPPVDGRSAQPPKDGNRAHSIPIPPRCRIEHVEVSNRHGALPSRLHQHGQVRGATRLTVRSDDEHTMVSILPHLVGVLSTPDGG